VNTEILNRTPILYGLECLRGLFAFAIAIWHFQHFSTVPESAQTVFERSGQPLYPLLWPLYEYGHYGVEFFWALSGYIFAHRYLEPLRSESMAPTVFVMKRVRRILPCHYATLLLVALLQSIWIQQTNNSFVYEHNDAKHFLLNLLMVNAWGLEDGYSFNGPFWSVSIEVPVYCLFLLVTLKSPLSTKQNWAVIAVLSLIAKSFGVANPLSECVFFFAFGLLIHQYAAQPSMTLRGVGVLLTSIGLVGVTQFTHGIRSIFLLIAISGLLIFFGHLRTKERELQPSLNGVCLLLGRLSYPVYLAHFPAQIFCLLILKTIFDTSPDPYSAPLLGAYLCVTLSLALLLHSVVEKPFLKY
jgi:peptidoglycan/LPS O-acetylase OafA/YrhL